MVYQTDHIKVSYVVCTDLKMKTKLDISVAVKEKSKKVDIVWGNKDLYDTIQ